MSVKDQIRKLPTRPGVYQFFDKKEVILYIGKAKDIKKRVTQHFQKSKNAPAKNAKMLTLVEKINHIETANEIEALILESTLIKEHRPKYNILLRDDKNFLYLKITTNQDYPQIFFVRRITDHRGLYLGPYTNATAIRQSLDWIKKIFPYECLTFFKKGVTQSACFNYHIHRCPGLCIGTVSKEEYRAIIQRIVRFLRGDIDDIIREFQHKMEAQAKEKAFEKAAKTRDIIANLKNISEKQNVDDPNLTMHQDVIAYVQVKHKIYTTLFKIRNGKLLHRANFTYTIPAIDLENGDAENHLANVLESYYTATTDIPRQIIVPHEVCDEGLLEEWLSREVGAKVEIIVPEKGKKHYLLELCEKNAMDYADKEILHEETTQGIRPEKGLEELREVLKLKQLPKRIECYDISHLGGKFTVASMVVMNTGYPDKADYRHFKMNTIGDKIDDYASMRETLQRRLKYIVNTTLRKLTKNKKESFLKKPDLIVMDGGKGQLGIGVEVLKELKLTNKIAIIGLAKEQEDIFIPGQEHPLLLDKISQAQYLIERIRDEAHRFANSFNRRLRDKGAKESKLDTVKGIGPGTKKKLIERFGSVKKAQQASDNDIENTIGKAMTKKFRESF